MPLIHVSKAIRLAHSDVTEKQKRSERQADGSFKTDTNQA